MPGIGSAWAPRAPQPDTAEALHRAVCRMLTAAVRSPPGQDHKLAAALADWGKAEVTLRLGAASALAYGPRAAIVHRLEGTAANAVQVWQFTGRAVLDQATSAVLDLALSTPAPLLGRR